MDFARSKVISNIHGFHKQHLIISILQFAFFTLILRTVKDILHYIVGKYGHR